MVTVTKKQSPTGFGRRLREHRERAGLTQSRLAELVETHQPNIAQMEAGTVEPTWPTVLRLAAALGITPDAFLDHPEAAEAAKPPTPSRPMGKRK